MVGLALERGERVLEAAPQVQLTQTQLRCRVAGAWEDTPERLAQRSVEVAHNQPRRPAAEGQELPPVGLRAAREGGHPPNARPARLVVADGAEDVDALARPGAAVDAETRASRALAAPASAPAARWP